MMNKTLLATALLVMGGAALIANDVPRFRGDNSQGMYLEEKGLLKTWPQEGLTPKWTASNLGEGWSSVVKVGNRLYITGTADSPDALLKKAANSLDSTGMPDPEYLAGAGSALQWFAAAAAADGGKTFVMRTVSPGEEAEPDAG